MSHKVEVGERVDKKKKMLPTLFCFLLLLIKINDLGSVCFEMNDRTEMRTFDSTICYVMYI